MDQRATIFLLGLLIAGFLYFYFMIYRSVRNFKDGMHAKLALTELTAKDALSSVQEISRDQLDKLLDSESVQIAKIRKEHLQGQESDEQDQERSQEQDEELSDQSKENMTFFHPLNTRQLPYYYYSYPFQYESGGAYPPNMFSRMYEWQPGFDVSGWSYWLRPGITYNKWPRNRWVKQNGNYYYINNGTNHKNSYNGLPS